MSAAKAKPRPAIKYPTFADVLRRVGDVPPERIYSFPAPGTAIEADLLDSEIVGDRGVELVDGILVEKTMGYREDYLGTRIIVLLGAFLDRHNLGAVAGGQGGVRFKLGLVRMPDVSFVRWDSLDDPDQVEDPDGAFLEVPPDLAVEVISPGNTPKEMEIKLGEYAKAGVKLVWYVYPERKEVDVFPKAKSAGRKTVGVGGALDGGAVLPGFALPVADIFARRAPAGSKRKKKGK